MLTHAADGFLEVEDGRVEALWRSLAAIAFQGDDGEPFEVQAFLVVHRQSAARVGHAAFYCRALRRTLVFSVDAVDGEDVSACGLADLARLGFRLKEVNLNLNSALRHVVLRDVPVLRQPNASDKPETTVVEPISAAATAIDLGDSDSAIAKRTAVLRHHRERDLDRKLQVLRAAIGQRLQAETPAPNGEPPPVARIADPASAAPGKAEAPAMAASDRQAHDEEFQAVAERRIRELQGQLVEAQSHAARLLEENRQLPRLEGRIAELTMALERAASQVEAEQQERQALTASHVAAVAAVAAAAEQLRVSVAQRVGLETALNAANRRVGDAEGTHAELKKELRTARKRLKVLEKQCHEGADDQPTADGSVAELRAQLAEVTEACDLERARAAELLLATRQHAQELAAARQRNDVLTDRLQSTETALDGAQAAAAAERQLRVELADQLSVSTARLGEAQLDSQRLERACADTEQRYAALAAELAGSGEPVPAAKPLPHQLRPMPKKGALFHPSWDVSGLPCQSADQVVQAWESVYNVQLSLEGYPSQYCAAFLVVVAQADRKQLYLLFSLKQSRHLLVCIPGQPPADEAALLKLINEAKKYLKKSGFEIEKIAAVDVPDTLGGYFTRA